MQNFLQIVRYLLILIAVWGASTIFFPIFAELSRSTYPDSSGSYFGNFSGLVGLVYALEFFLPLIVILFGNSYRYYVVGLFVIPMTLIALITDISHALVWGGAITAGIGLGTGLRFLCVSTLVKMSSMQPYRKYF